MNKYSKRALKTTATVGMSLAMVLSAAVMPVSAAGFGVCAGDPAALVDAACGRAVFAELFEKDILDYDMDSSLEIKIEVSGAEAEVNAFYAVSKYTPELKKYAATLSLTDAKLVNAWTKATDSITEMIASSFTSTHSTIETIMNDSGTLGQVATKINEDNDDTTTTDVWGTANKMKALTGANLTALKDAKKAMDDFANEEKGAYKHLSSDLKDVFDSVKSDFDALYDDAFGSSTDAELAEFVIAFDKVLKNDLKEETTTLTAAQVTITGLPVKSGTGDNNIIGEIKLSSKSQVTGRMKKIKEANLYNTVKDEESVIAILDAYQAILDDLAGTSDLTKEAAYTDFMKTKTEDVDKTVKVALNEMMNASGVANTSKDRIDAIAKNIDGEQFSILKALKEDVLDSIYTLKTRKIGNYHVNDTEESKTVVSTQKTTVMKNVPNELIALVNTEKGLFGYDVIEARMADVAVALAAVTTDIEKITPTNIKSTDKKTLEAAEDALYDLTADSKFKGNLTTKEARDVRNADRKIANLREAFDNLGTTTVAGWYDMGNGNWGYNNEDGTPAAYKWVASGSNWYFVRDGKMARNTWLAANSTDWYYLGSDGKMATSVSVDGCWINSLGIYTK